MDKYNERLYKEFYDSKNVNQLNIKKYNFNFDNWINEKEKMLKLYSQFLKTMDFIPSRGVVEFDKGYLDSVLPYYDDDCKKIMITEYTKNMKNKRNFVCINGEVTVDKNIIIEYDGYMRELDFINFFITQLPVSDDVLNLLIDIGYSGKNIFIGAYGSLKDQDKDKKIRKLYELKKEMSIYLNRNVDGEITYTDDYYLSAITPRYKVNVKKENKYKNC